MDCVIEKCRILKIQKKKKKGGVAIENEIVHIPNGTCVYIANQN